MPGKVEAATESLVKNLEAKTGKSLAEWMAVARASGKSKHAELVKHLQSAHDLTFGYANYVTHAALGKLEPSSDDPVGAMYSGAKAVLRPIHDAIIAAISVFGDDVELAPKKGYVSVRRAKQFAIIQPSTQTRVDVGLNLKGIATTARLEASGSFNAMVTHRVRVETLDEVDAALIAWLEEAYNRA